jgi:diguanylate cyclase (GGDEF)-like protein
VGGLWTRRRIFVLAGCLIAIGLLTVTGIAASADYRIGFLYLGPLVIAAWWLDRRLALSCAATASVGLVAGDVTRGTELPLDALLWNEFTRVTTLLATTAFVSSLRGSRDRLEAERDAMVELTVTDPLTGLYNRRFLEEQMRILHSGAARRRGSFSVLAIDVDGLKRLNDEHGHAAGDAALAAIAAVLRNAVRRSDVVARTGGDEFVVLAPEMAIAQAADLASRLVRAVAAGAAGPGPRLAGVSIGVASWDGHESSQRLLERADQLQYAAKRLGGARFVVEAL